MGVFSIESVDDTGPIYGLVIVNQRGAVLEPFLCWLEFILEHVSYLPTQKFELRTFVQLIEGIDVLDDCVEIFHCGFSIRYNWLSIFSKLFSNTFIENMTDKIKAVGSKAEVFHGTARHTSGGLVRASLVLNKHGRIVSRKKQALGRKSIKHLFALGFKPKKGKFSLMRKSMAKGKKGKRSTKKRGGATEGASLSEAFETKQ